MQNKKLVSLIAVVLVALLAGPAWSQTHTQDTFLEQKTCAGDQEDPSGYCAILSTSPTFQIVSDEGDYPLLLVEDKNTTVAQRMLVKLANLGNIGLRFDHTGTTNATDWELQTTPTDASNFAITKVGSGEKEFELDGDGNLSILGELTLCTGSACTETTYPPDYVFHPEYELMPISDLAQFVQENQHLPNVPSSDELKQNGLNMIQMQYTLLEKVEELTLYTITQQQLIEQQQETIRRLEERLDGAGK